MGAKLGDKVVLVKPGEVVEIMKKVPEGKLITIVEICKQISEKQKVKARCSHNRNIHHDCGKRDQRSC